MGKYVNFKIYEKLLENIYKIIGKKENFTIEDVTEFYKKKSNAQVFDSLREMADKLNFPNNGDDYDNVELYTDYVIEAPYYKCYDIPKGDNYSGNELFVQYDKDSHKLISYFSYFSNYGCAEMFVFMDGWRDKLVEYERKCIEADKKRESRDINQDLETFLEENGRN